MKDKILFIEPFKNRFVDKSLLKSVEPNASTLRCINLLKNKFEVDFIDFKADCISKKSFIEYIKKGNYKYYFIEIKTYNRHFSLKIIEIIKSYIKSPLIICFGQHVSEDPPLILNKFKDCLIIKDEIYPFFINFYKNHGISSMQKMPNLIYLRKSKIIYNKYEEITDLNLLPCIDLEILKQKKYYTLYPMKTLKRHEWGFLNLTKGCSHNCLFCSQTLRITFGKENYNFSVKESIKRIRRLVDNGFNFIRFFDDNFLCSGRFIKDLCNKIIKKGIEFKWMAQIRADCLDEELLRTMKAAGCECLNIGVETGSDRIMKILKKQETVNDIWSCFELCHKHKILTVAFFMIGNPGETLEDLNLSYKLIKEIKPNMLQIAYFTPYPGSEYYNRLTKQEKNKVGFFHYEDLISNFSKVEKKDLAKTMKKWYLAFYLNPKNFLKLGVYRFSCFVFNPIRETKIIIKLLKYLVKQYLKND